MLDSEVIHADEYKINSFILNEQFEWTKAFKIFQRSYDVWIKNLPSNKLENKSIDRNTEYKNQKSKGWMF